jgi:hypothetical protein
MHVRAWDPPASYSQPQVDDGPGVIQTLQSGLNDSIRRGTGQAPADLIGSLTAALTGLFVDAAKDLLDQNLPGFKERYEEAERSAGSPRSGTTGAMGGASASSPQAWSHTASQQDASINGGVQSGVPSTAASDI